jgi:nitroimidazol reductase NimA-like FMN-containing flavoprotein (pyridoxamine 5'-phosphate oxidase superfamily)
MARDYQKVRPAQYQRLPEYARDEAWVREFLHRGLIGHVAHLSGDQPFITPTNFWFDEAGRRIIFHSNIAGRVRSNLEHFPKVCFETSEFGRFLPANTALEFSTQFRSVMVFGTVKILEEAEEKRAALYGLLGKYFPHMTPGKEYRPITDKELARTSVYALQIESWSGKENWNEQAEQSSDWPPLPAEILNAPSFSGEKP